MTRVEMKKEATRELLERLQEYDALNVMKAYVEGKEIECSPLDEDRWTQINDPGWSWHVTRYRIKPGPKYRPYNDMREFAEAMLQPGRDYIRNKKDHSMWYTIEALNKRTVSVLGQRNFNMVLNYHDMLSHYEWDDGSPCGVLVKDEDK